VNDVALLDEDAAGHLAVLDFEDGGIAAEALHLDDVFEADLFQEALEPGGGRPSDEFLEDDINGFEALGGAGFSMNISAPVARQAVRFSSEAKAVRVTFLTLG